MIYLIYLMPTLVTAAAANFEDLVDNIISLTESEETLPEIWRRAQPLDDLLVKLYGFLDKPDKPQAKISLAIDRLLKLRDEFAHDEAEAREDEFLDAQLAQNQKKLDLLSNRLIAIVRTYRPGQPLLEAQISAAANLAQARLFANTRASDVPFAATSAKQLSDNLEELVDFFSELRKTWRKSAKMLTGASYDNADASLVDWRVRGELEKRLLSRFIETPTKLKGDQVLLESSRVMLQTFWKKKVSEEGCEQQLRSIFEELLVMFQGAEGAMLAEISD